MKHWKKVVAVLLALSVLFLFAACSSTKQAAGNEQQTPAPAAETGTESENTAAPIVIGHYSYLTGPSSLLGQSITNGVMIAVDKINEEGGINGRKIEVVTYDSKADQETSKQVVTKLLNVDKVCAIIADASSGDLKATFPMTEEAGIVQIGHGVSTALTNIGNRYTFRSTASAKTINATMVDMMKDLNIKTLGALVVNSEYGENGLAVVKECMEEAGSEVEIVATEYYAMADVDYSAQIAKLISKNPDAILLYSNTNEASIAIGQVRAQGYTGYVLGTEGCASSEIRDVAGADAEGLIFTAAYVIPDEIDDAINDVEKDFLNRYVDKHGEIIVSDTGYRSYDAACMLFEAMKKCEDPSDPEQIRNAFVTIKDYEGIGGTFDYTDESGDGLFAVRKFIVHDGKNMLLDDYIAQYGLK